MFWRTLLPPSYYIITQLHNPEDLDLNLHHHENLKSQNNNLPWGSIKDGEFLD